jgi:hypothetical protein
MSDTAQDIALKRLDNIVRRVLSIISRVILLIAFFGFFMPVGFLMRLFGRDPLQRRLDPAVNSYYQSSKERANNHMDKPF